MGWLRWLLVGVWSAAYLLFAASIYWIMFLESAIYNFRLGDGFGFGLADQIFTVGVGVILAACGLALWILVALGILGKLK